MKIEFRWCAPAAHFLVVSSRATDRHARVRYVGNRKQQVALPGIKHSNASVDFLDEVRSLLHFRDEVIGALFILLEPGNFLAGFIALRFAPLIEGNEFAALLIQRTEAVQLESDVALLRHFGEDVQMLAKVAEVMHEWEKDTVIHARGKCREETPCSAVSDDGMYSERVAYECRGTSLINSKIFPSESRKAFIHKSYVGMGAIRRGGATICTLRSTRR